ncbi:MAG: amino acid ABC transporter ATP-binding protein [Deltaproteobacteria bacterium]|nr:amino acid ABC transporter ATP-binding protein [Deltaproteobacteria bacterium]
MSELVVDVRRLSTRLGARMALRDVDLQVRRGEVVAIVGPSGGGKTTLLRGLNYLTPFHGGSVEIAGQRLEPGLSERRDAARLREVRRRVGMVFQHFHLFPHLDVLGNVMEAPRHVLGMDVDACRRRAETLLNRVGLLSHARAYPQTLSGGQQQRAAIARALAMEPEILLLDEPTSALDPQLVDEVLAVVADLAAAGQTMIIVTHEMRFARRVAHRMIVLAEGQVQEQGAPSEVLTNPRSAAGRSLVGRE